MEEISESKDPVLTLPLQLPVTTQVQKSLNKKKSKNKKPHTINTMNDELITATTTTTKTMMIDQCTNDNNLRKSSNKSKIKEPGEGSAINGLVQIVKKMHIKDNGHCLSNGSNVGHHKFNGHNYDGEQYENELTIATTTATPANQILKSSTVSEKSKKCKSKSKNREHCQVQNVETCVENGEHLLNINTGEPTVLSTAKKTTTITTTIVADNQNKQQIEKIDIIATAAAAAAIICDDEEIKSIENETLVTEPALEQPKIHIDYTEYQSELQMHDIMRLIQAELSEPYSIYTYRYFIYNWPKLCFLAAHGSEYVGAIVCKLDMHVGVKRGYIAMLAVRKEYRNLKIGSTLVQKAIDAMVADNADEVVLETEMRNYPALHLYENLGFVRDKRLFRYYLNGVDALRLKLWFR